MPTEIEKIFTAEAQSIWRFLIENGQGCYIPGYQRHYSWDTVVHIPRFFEDLLQGVKRVSKRPSSIIFLGTIIAIHDLAVDKSRSQDAPGKVMTIIDGQQRICTTIILIIVLHAQIRKLSIIINQKLDCYPKWIVNEANEVLAHLRNSYLIDRTSGDDLYKFYPRVIRAYDDTWSRYMDDAKYESPIARLIWKYINFSESNEKPKSEFDPLDNNESSSRYKVIQDAFRYINKKVVEICGTSENSDFPAFDIIFDSDSFAEEIWRYPLPDEVKKFISNNKSDQNYKDFSNLLRLLIFARYLTRQVAITVVTAENEDDALDMFEALNTTGAQLTALDTFKPKVIEHVGKSQYKRSRNHQHFIEIDNYIDQFNKVEDKTRATNELLVSFALSETGKKLSNKFYDQRHYLRDEYKKLSSDDKKCFVKSIACMAEFMQQGWTVKKNIKPLFPNLKIEQKHEEALVGFEFLKGLKHTITIAPLYRFYEQAINSDDIKEKNKRTDDFILAIKATVAFSTFWRGAFGGTANIDSYYRKVMNQGVNYEGHKIPPLAHRPEEINGKTVDLSLKNYKKSLELILKINGKISTKKDWIKKISQIGVYKSPPTLAKFLLFCASHDALPSSEKGLIKKGRKDISPLLQLNQWNNVKYVTVEHIAPLNGENWNNDIYENSETVNSLGNLILLPRKENQVLGNRKWEHKRLLYNLLSSETDDEFNKIKKQLSRKGLNLSINANEVFGNSAYQNMCKSVGDYDKEWSLAIIEKRTECLAGLAWDYLESWLI